jgi:rubrerythrin
MFRYCRRGVGGHAKQKTARRHPRPDAPRAHLFGSGTPVASPFPEVRDMTTFRRFILAAGMLVAVLAVIVPTSQSATGSSGAALRSSTLDNLQTAYNGESNARTKYLAFADQAVKEGYPAVASLFRAAAEAESIHAANVAIMIKQMGARPVARVETLAPKTTEENLRSAIAGETHERDALYPEFIKAALVANVPIVVKAYTNMMHAEAEHAKLYTADLKALPKLKGKPAQQYFVCPTCGLTLAKRPAKACECGMAADKFRPID